MWSARQRACLYGLAILIVLAGRPVPAKATDLGHCFSGGCDVMWDMSRQFDEVVQSTSAGLAGPAKEGFDAAMRSLFAERIGPALDRVTQVATGRMDQAGPIIDETEDGVARLVDQAGKIAAKNPSGNASRISAQILRRVDKKAKLLVDKIDADTASLVDTQDCIVDGNPAALQSWAQSQLDSMPHPFNACYAEAGFHLTAPSSSDLLSIYLIKRCEIIKDLDGSPSVSRLLDNYARLSLLSRRFACALRNTKGEELATADSRMFGSSYDLWKLTVK